MRKPGIAIFLSALVLCSITACAGGNAVRTSHEITKVEGLDALGDLLPVVREEPCEDVDLGAVARSIRLSFSDLLKYVTLGKK